MNSSVRNLYYVFLALKNRAYEQTPDGIIIGDPKSAHIIIPLHTGISYKNKKNIWGRNKRWQKYWELHRDDYMEKYANK